jgi:hypothetical protein
VARSLSALVLFHVSGGARVASRNAIATIGAIIIVLGSAPDPWVWLRFLAVGVAGAGHYGGPLVGLTVIAYALAREAVPRLTLGLGGWTRSLSASADQHRRGVIYGLPIIQLPLALAVVMSAVLTKFAYHVPLSWPKLVGAPLALIAAGAAAVPASRWFLAAPLFGATAILASLGSPPLLLLAIVVFPLADLVAGDLRFPSHRKAVASPATPGSLRLFRFTWRALGWRLLAPAPMPALALAAAWFYSRNNELNAVDTSFVARLWCVIAIALYVGAIGDTIVTRRPSWPWIRSLPWSSADRARDDAIAIGIPALAIALATALVDVRTVLIALSAIPPLAAVAAWLLHGARRRLTRVSGPLIIVGAAVGTVVALWPWAIIAPLAATPLLLRAAARTALAYVPEHPDLTPYATVGEVLGLVCRLRGRPVSDGDKALATVGLDGLGDRSVRELSMGQRRRAVLAAAFVGEPSNLLLDEPLEAMDRAMRSWLTSWISEASTRDATVLVATHDVEPFTALARRAIVVAGGIPRLVDLLPSAMEARARFLDSSARGESSAVGSTELRAIR